MRKIKRTFILVGIDYTVGFICRRNRNAERSFKIYYRLIRKTVFVQQCVLPHNLICAANLFYQVYFSHPIIYTVIFLGIDFVMGGIWACTALACSFLSDYKMVVAVCPFFLQLGIHVICTMLDAIDHSSIYFTQSGYGMKSTVVPALYIIIGFASTWVIFRKRGEKEDIF